MQFQPHQQRVVDEKTALDELITKLKSFIETNPIFDKLDADEQGRLCRQLTLMESYSFVLAERVAAFV